MRPTKRAVIGMLAAAPFAGCTAGQSRAEQEAFVGTKNDPKRIWKVGQGLDSIAGMEWINRPLPEGRELPSGPFRTEGNRFGVDVWGTGFPDMETPVFRIDRKLGRAPTDMEWAVGGARWFISDPAKQLFEKLDASAFHFIPVQTVLRDGGGEREGVRYWLADVVRFLDAFDMESGAFYEDNGRQRPNGLDVERFKPEVVADHMIFRAAHAPLSIYCTDALKQAVRAAGLNGFGFAGGGRING